MSSNKPKICIYYLKNACQRGRSCVYLHQRPPLSYSNIKSSKSGCKYYQLGKCAYGDKCTRGHDPGPSTKTSTQTSDKRNGSSSSRGHSPMGAGSSGSQRGQSDAESQHEKQQNGGLGDQDTDPWQSPGMPEDPSFDQQQESSAKASCIFYTQGACLAGDTCEFKHEDPQAPASPQCQGNAAPDEHVVAAMKRSVCRHYLKGNCTSGLQCRYKHTVLEYKESTEPSVSNSNLESSSFSNPFDRSASGGPDADEEGIGQSYENNNGEQEEEAEQPHHSERDITESLEYAASDPPDEEIDEDEQEIFVEEAEVQRKPDEYSDESQSDEEDHYNSRKDSLHSPRQGWSLHDSATASQGISGAPQRLSGSNDHNTNGQPSVPSPPIANTSPMMQPTIQPSLPQYPHVSEVKLHWSQFADPLANPNTPFCKLHAQGRCLLDEACRFRHSLTVAEYSSLFHDLQPNLWTLQRVASSSQMQQEWQQIPPIAPPSVPVHQAVDIQSPQPPLSTQPTAQANLSTSTFGQECKFYPIGKCRNGDLCPYKHTQHPPTELQETTANGSDDWNFGAHRPTSNLPCKFFARRGVCDRGDTCRYRHGDGGYPSSRPSGPQSSPSSGEDEANGWTSNWESKHDDKEHGQDDNGGNEWTAQPDESGWGETPTWGQTNSTSRPRPTKPCFDFTKGRCRRENACRFSHDMEPRNGDQKNSWASGGDSWPPQDDASGSDPWGQQGAGGAQQQDANDDNGWSQSWEQEPSPQAVPMKSNIPCKFFGQGYCREGDNCAMKHIKDSIATVGHDEKDSESPPTAPAAIENDERNDTYVNEPVGEDETAEPTHQEEEPEPEEEPRPESESESDPELELDPIVFEHQDFDKFILNSLVRFGSDSTPTSVTTAAESCKLVLANLPPEVIPHDINVLLTPYGEVRNCRSLDETADSATIEVELDTPDQAMEAFRKLHGSDYESREIEASMKTRITLTMRSPNDGTCLKVSWPKATASAWSHYPNIRKAKSEATRLDGAILGGQQIKATFVTPNKRQRDSFAIDLRNLPATVTKAEVEGLCIGSTLVTLNQPSYSDDPVERIRDALSHFGEVDFDVVPSPENQVTSNTLTAFATFKSQTMAIEAREALDSKHQEYLGKQPLSVRSVHYCRYKISRTLFTTLQKEVDRLADKGGKECVIQYNDYRDGNQIRVHSVPDKQATFADINGELASLVRGQVLESDEGYVWSTYFETSSSAKALKQLPTDALIHCDQRAKCVRIFGSKADQVKAKSLMFKLLSKVHAQQHELDVPRPQLHLLLNGLFDSLQTEMGSPKLDLDVISSKVIVRGTQEDISKVKAAVDSLDDTPVQQFRRGHCQICHQPPMDPVLLSCRHAYCKACMKKAVEYAGHAPLQCISQKHNADGEVVQCAAYVPYAVIHDIFIPAEEKAFLQSSFYAYVRSRPGDLFFCPSLDCMAVYRTGEPGLNLRCSFCISEICTYCKSHAHIGLTCIEMKRR
ncbi:unnamed protein product [Cyclocybe aegerita]|uniref:RING-type E3 ubiquitin transferase n=1 Tax=Cyclocybe aegerita TaxID=1973307 RepID=A0A8S0WL61_CYCAE|nr:unnamed protein product [Cyclocybe aegerita]